MPCLSIVASETGDDGSWLRLQARLLAAGEISVGLNDIVMSGMEAVKSYASDVEEETPAWTLWELYEKKKREERELQAALTGVELQSGDAGTSAAPLAALAPQSALNRMVPFPFGPNDGDILNELPLSAEDAAIDAWRDWADMTLTALYRRILALELRLSRQERGFLPYTIGVSITMLDDASERGMLLYTMMKTTLQIGGLLLRRADNTAPDAAARELGKRLVHTAEMYLRSGANKKHVPPGISGNCQSRRGHGNQRAR